MEPQSHPLLHFLVRMKPTSMNVFPQVAKNVNVTRGKIWAVQRIHNLTHSRTSSERNRIPRSLSSGHKKCGSHKGKVLGCTEDPQPHPLSHFLVWMKQNSTNVFLQVIKNLEVTRGQIWAVQRMLKYFPTKSLKFIPHQIGGMGIGVIIQNDDSIQQHSRAFWLYGTSYHSQPPWNEPHLAALLCLPPFPMLDNTLYTTLTFRAIKKQLCGPVHFHYACLLSYRWQYWYATRVLPAFARNVFHGGCSVFIGLPLILKFP